MSSTFIKVSTIANVGNDPEIRTFGNGGRVANFSVATSQTWKDKTTGERKEKTEWHRVAVLNKGLVGVVEKYVKKGSKLYIEGTLKTRKWQDRDGNDQYTTEIVLQGYGAVLKLLDKKAADAPKGQDDREHGEGDNTYEGMLNEDLDDEIPF